MPFDGLIILFSQSAAALVYCILNKETIVQMWTTRITGGCEELGITFDTLRKGLTNSNILLNRKSLADLAIWEPRSFKVSHSEAKCSCR